MHMGGRVIIDIDDDRQAMGTKDRYHDQEKTEQVGLFNRAG
jgi:hypothetical protein